MSSIYIHIPFCTKKCSYCNFHFSIQKKMIDEMIDAICKEIHLKKNENLIIETVYIGGGTPSLLSSYHLESILKSLNNSFNFSAVKEFTFEINPENISKKYLLELKKFDINRLSIGCQTFKDENLILLNRNHTTNDSINAIKIAKEIGFENITIDLIYGIPNQSLNEWEYDIDKAISLKIPHISAYALTIEPKTNLYHLINNKKLFSIDDDIQYHQFTMLQEKLMTNNYFQYEVSNFAKKGYIAQHNSAYWKGASYIGIGPSAHSFDGLRKRSWNIANNTKYIRQIENNIIPENFETLSDKNLYNEYIMLGLRTENGINEIHIKEKYSKFYKQFISKKIKYLDEKILLQNKEKIKISSNHMFKSDGIISDFFVS